SMVPTLLWLLRASFRARAGKSLMPRSSAWPSSCYDEVHPTRAPYTMKGLMSHAQVVAIQYLFASDFDQTLSFNDSGAVLSEVIGVAGFEDRVAGLARSNLVQQGAELAYLLRHDPAFRGVRQEHLIETGRRLRLKADIPRLM